MSETSGLKYAENEVGENSLKKKRSKPDTTYLPDLQRRHMWKKVIANEKTKKDKIVH